MEQKFNLQYNTIYTLINNYNIDYLLNNLN